MITTIFIVALALLSNMCIKQIRVYITTQDNYIAKQSRNIAIVLAFLCIALLSALLIDRESFLSTNHLKPNVNEEKMQNELFKTAGNMVPLKRRAFYFKT